MARKTNKFRSSSAERRHKQDTHALVVYTILAIVGLAAWLWDAASDVAVGALVGSMAPVFIMMLRYIFRVVNKQRMDPMGLLTSMLFIVAFVIIAFFCYPHTLWQGFIVIVTLVATVFGVQRFRLSPLFMLINCMIASAILI